MSKPIKSTAARSLVAPIVGDAAIATQFAEGRLLPVLILDTLRRPEITELIRVHAYMQGDVASRWASSRDDDDVVMLILTFERPLEVELILEFSIEHQAMLVECILSGGAVYLQTGVPGDRLLMTMEAPRMLVEVPASGFRAYWEQLFLNRMTIVMSRRLGVPRKKARPVAQRLIAELKQLANFRIPQV